MFAGKGKSGIAFIGDYDEPERIKDAINSIPLPRLRLRLSEKGKFGDLLWAGIQENQKLNAYVKKLRAALKEAGIPYAHDKFVPHITLIRRSVSKKPYQVHLQKAEMNVDKISLMKSERMGRWFTRRYRGDLDHNTRVK